MSAEGRPLEVLVDMTRTVLSRGRMVGTVRVESEFASALLATHPDVVVPVSWSSTEETFVELDRDAALRYVAPGGCSDDEVRGWPLEATRACDRARRRILLVTGGGWLSNIRLLHGMFRVRRALGAELHVVVHDLVHLLFPHWASREEALKSGSAHEAILAGADRLLVYSDSTARDIARLAERRGLLVHDVARMVLGTTLPVPHASASPVSEGLDSLADRPFALYVSSIAARKNHGFIAHVWARLAMELGARLPRLIFVGHVAPDQGAMMDRLSRDPGLADHLVHVSGATDADLRWLYRHCLFTVFPSLYEGWGLPVAESLAAGKVCLASNASSIPELTSGVTPLLDPLDIRAWCDTVRRMVLEPEVRDAAERRVRDLYRPITWPEAADRLWRAMEPARVSRPDRSALTIGAPPAAQPLPPLVVADEPWRPLRSALGGVAAYRTRFGVQLPELPVHGMRLDLWMRNVSSAAVRAEIEINGAVTDVCVVEPGPSTCRRFDLPNDVLLSRGVLDIVTSCQPLASVVASDVPRVCLEAVSTRALTADEEASAIAARREIWRRGDVLDFASGSRHLTLLKSGWDEPARWGVWTVASAAAMGYRPVPHPSEPVVLRAKVRGFVPAARPALDVDVLVNGTRLATWSFRHPKDFSFVERTVVIPPELVVDGLVNLQLSMPDVVSPSQLGMSQDDRQLGVGLGRAQWTTRDDSLSSSDWTSIFI